MTHGYGEFVKKHRIASGYKKQKELAEKTGISAATISRIENEIQLPEVRTLKELANVLHTTTYNELLSVCGYSDNELTKTKIELTDKNIFDMCELTLDGKLLTDTELKGIIAYVRLLRGL